MSPQVLVVLNVIVVPTVIFDDMAWFESLDELVFDLKAANRTIWFPIVGIVVDTAANNMVVCIFLAQLHISKGGHAWRSLRQYLGWILISSRIATKEVAVSDIVLHYISIEDICSRCFDWLGDNDSSLFTTLLQRPKDSSFCLALCRGTL